MLPDFSVGNAQISDGKKYLIKKVILLLFIVLASLNMAMVWTAIGLVSNAIRTEL